MKHIELLQLLDELRALPHETEWVEFKEARNSYDFNKLGCYFAALANEANLKKKSCGWLVFGVVNQDHSICGSGFREKAAQLDSLKHDVARQTGGITFLEIHVADHSKGRVVLFQVPPAPPGIPVAWLGHWYGRDGEALVPLSLHKLETIRSQIVSEDWSAEVCPDATVADLEPKAIEAARAYFRAKNQDKSFAAAIDSWSDATFLDRAKITHGGRITRAALLLLGRPQAAVHLQPAVAQITWRLEGAEKAYEHFARVQLLLQHSVLGRPLYV